MDPIIRRGKELRMALQGLPCRTLASSWMTRMIRNLPVVDLCRNLQLQCHWTTRENLGVLWIQFYCLRRRIPNALQSVALLSSLFRHENRIFNEGRNRGRLNCYFEPEPEPTHRRRGHLPNKILRGPSSIILSLWRRYYHPSLYTTTTPIATP